VIEKVILQFQKARVFLYPPEPFPQPTTELKDDLAQQNTATLNGYRCASRRRKVFTSLSVFRLYM
jgi:hypothetical protein